GGAGGAGGFRRARTRTRARPRPRRRAGQDVPRTSPKPPLGPHQEFGGLGRGHAHLPDRREPSRRGPHAATQPSDHALRRNQRGMDRGLGHEHSESSQTYRRATGPLRERSEPIQGLADWLATEWHERIYPDADSGSKDRSGDRAEVARKPD